MRIPATEVTVPVDLANPGQFFACCGLFELADRLWPKAELCAHFDSRGFVMLAEEPGFSLIDVLRRVGTAECRKIDPDDDAASKLELLAPFGVRLDWWWKPQGGYDLGTAGSLKTWAGQQSGPAIFDCMRQALSRAASVPSPFDYSEVIFGAKGQKKTISPFYFDSRRQGTSLDLGFSPDEQGMSVEAYPAVEALALIGLQRFRPHMDETTSPRSFIYTAWAEPLPVMVAAASVSSMVQVRSYGCFRFTKPSRGGEYATMFSRATRERSMDA